MTVHKNALEWTVFAAALLIVSGSVAMLVAGMIRGGEEPADLIVSTAAAERIATGFRVEVHVRNAGDQTAEDVHVEVALERDGETVEKAELTFAFVPRRSERSGFVVFRRDPKCCEIVPGTVGFESP